MPLVPEKLKDMIKNLLNDHLAENKMLHDFRLSLGFLSLDSANKLKKDSA